MKREGWREPTLSTKTPRRTKARRERTRLGSNFVDYHAIHEAVAATILRVVKEDGMTNLADLFTKVLMADC
jgi:hypothetical protein